MYVDSALRGDVACPACGLVAQHQQTISAHREGYWSRAGGGWWQWRRRRRWVACFRCSSCAAPFTADVPRARGGQCQ